jgi:hypothetical protein
MMISLKTFALAAAMVPLCTAGAQAGSVSGVATDQNGAPLAGVQVEVVYQSMRADQLANSGESIKATAVTDSDGRYVISTDDLPPGEYAANAFQVVTNGGQERNVDLSPEDSSTFAGNADTVRNFTASLVESSEDQPYGNAGVFVLNNAIGDVTDLTGAEVTLTNSETGETFVRTVRPSGEGLVVTGIPFGTYRATVTLNGQPLQIKLWGPNEPDEFSSEIVHDFTMGYLGNQIQVAVKP